MEVEDGFILINAIGRGISEQLGDNMEKDIAYYTAQVIVEELIKSHDITIKIKT